MNVPPSLSRRKALLSMTALTGAGLSWPHAPAQAAGLNVALFKALVPELFASVPRAPSYVKHLVIGSGFGGAISALRLAQAGESVAILERGFKWPNDPWRPIFASELNPDGRAFWFKKQLKTSSILDQIDLGTPFAGVVDQTDYPNMSVVRGACVGGGSVVFTGVMIQPERRYFDAIFQGQVNYQDMDRTYYPRVRQMLKLSAMPSDIYKSMAFGHSRVWDDQARKAGYTPTATDSLFNWSVVRQELKGQCLPSATIGLSNLGNSNGAKFDLNQNYLKLAEATGRAQVHAGHQVNSIGWDGSRYVVDINRINPEGKVLERLTVSCDRLYLAAGSVGTSELLVKAKAQGTLRQLNDEVGQGWGTNGDAVTVRTLSAVKGLTQGAPCASKLHDDRSGLPITLENWYAPAITFDLGIVRSLAMTYDETNRGHFSYNAATDQVDLNWSAQGNADAVAMARLVNNRIADASNSTPGLGSLAKDVNGLDWTAHPLGGAVLGQVTDAYGRVKGHPGLYVMDGAAIPGSTGTVNPSLTISALAERNIEMILRSGG